MSSRPFFDDRRLRPLRTLYPRTVRMFTREFDWRITGRWMAYSALVGVAAALGAILFTNLITLLQHGTLQALVGYHGPEPGGEADPMAAFDLSAALEPTRRWLLLIVPAAGGLVSGWLVFKFAPEAEGHGTDAVIRAFHHEEGRIRPRVPLVKTIASAVTLGTGGSAGREGPIAQVGAGLGSLLANRLGLSTSDRRMLLVAGMAAGVSSIFRSPLGGAFFAVEVLYRQDLEAEALMPAVIAGITGYSVYSSLEESSSVFTTPEFRFINPLELLPIIVFALLCTIVGIYFVRIFYGTKRNLFERLPIPAPFKPALGGLLVGAIAFVFPAVLGSSYGWLQQAIDGNLPMALMGLLVIAKILATSLTISSGGSGGVFAPSLVIGGMLGGLVGTGLSVVAPALVHQPQAYVLIGMAAFFAGVAHVPIAATIMISELTGHYTLLVPLIFAAVIAHVVTKKWGLYTQQVPTFKDSPAHRPDLIPDLLEDVRVGRIVERPSTLHVLAPQHTLDEILDVFARTDEVILPIEERGNAADRAERYSGLVLLEDVQELLQSNTTMRRLLIAKDLEVPFVAVRRRDTLSDAVDTFVTSTYPELPVIDDEGEIIGFIRQGQVLNEYYRAYVRQHTGTAA